MALRQASRRLAVRQVAGGLLASAAPPSAAPTAASALAQAAAKASSTPSSSLSSSSLFPLPLLLAAQQHQHHLLHTSAAPRDPAKPAPSPVPLSKLKDSFNDATSVTYLEELEQRYRRDPHSVDTTWASFFRSLGGF
jgi:hypothetical protein